MDSSSNGAESNFAARRSTRSLSKQQQHQQQLPIAFFDESRVKIDSGGRKINTAVNAFIREDYIVKRMVEREAEFMEHKNINVFTGTWNVNGKKVDEDLTKWLKAPNEKMAASTDIYVIGFQEMVELNTQSVLLSHALPGIEARSKLWQKKISAVINAGRDRSSADEFVLLESGYLVGVMLCVFARRSICQYLSEVAVSYAGVGYGGFMGNKGGVAIRFSAHDSTFCFVCAHLAAHREKVKERNNDFANLSRKIVFEVVPNQAAAPGKAGATADEDSTKRAEGDDRGQHVSVPGHDVLVWLGDFNYRIDASLSVDEVHRRCDRGDISYLLRHDQLNTERKQGNVFVGFEEGPIDFMPSYKYQPKTNKYERRPDKKKRAPAWCDRVLWNTVRKGDVQQMKYGRAELLTSDHKPVYSVFKMRAKKVIEDAKAKVVAEITRSLDQWENEQIPEISLSTHTLAFGEVCYEERVVRKLVIRNIRKTIATFRFVPKLEEKLFCKPWMTIHPKFGMLTPGEKATIDVVVHVDFRTARHFATKRDSLEDILILRLEGGRDYFVSINGKFAPSSFGMQLEELSTRTRPVRCMRRNIEAETDVPSSKTIAEVLPPISSQRMQIPKELWRLCDALFTTGLLETEGLFIKGGLPSEMASIRRSLDTGTTFSQCSPHSTAAVLFEFLRSLSSPVLSPSLFNLPDIENIESSRIAKWCDEILSHLKPLQYNVFVYLLLFFKESLAHSEKNGLQADILIRIITPRFTWNEREDLLEPGAVKKYQNQAGIFLKYLITQDYF